MTGKLSNTSRARSFCVSLHLSGLLVSKFRLLVSSSTFVSPLERVSGVYRELSLAGLRPRILPLYFLGCFLRYALRALTLAACFFTVLGLEFSLLFLRLSLGLEAQFLDGFTTTPDDMETVYDNRCIWKTFADDGIYAV